MKAGREAGTIIGSPDGDFNHGCNPNKFAITVDGGEFIGPILMGMRRPVHVLQRAATVEVIVNVASIAVVDARENDGHTHPYVHVSVEPERVGEHGPRQACAETVGTLKL